MMKMVDGCVGFIHNTATYQWQVSTDSGTSWTDISESSNYSGVTNDTLRIQMFQLILMKMSTD